jgi:hypothetical protein
MDLELRPVILFVWIVKHFVAIKLGFRKPGASLCVMEQIQNRLVLSGT